VGARAVPAGRQAAGSSAASRDLGSYRGRLAGLVVLAVTAASLAAPPPARAEPLVLVVTTEDDNVDPAGCLPTMPGGSGCSLRGALHALVRPEAGDPAAVVVEVLPGTIALNPLLGPLPLPLGTADLSGTSITIRGVGTSPTEVLAPAEQRLLEAREVGEVVLEHLRLVGGEARTTPDDDGDGGAVLATDVGRLLLERVLASANVADRDGGAVAVRDHSPDGDVTTAVDVIDSTFDDNTAQGSGGAISVRSPGATVSVAISGFAGNRAGLDEVVAGDRWSGGAVYVRGAEAVDLADVTITDSLGAAMGGGLAVVGPLDPDRAPTDVTIAGATFTDNDAAVVSGSGIDGAGGSAIAMVDADADLSGVAATGGQSYYQGAISIEGWASAPEPVGVRLTDTTIADNDGLFDGTGLHLDRADARLAATTIADNRSEQDTGGLRARRSTVRLVDTVVADNDGPWGSGIWVSHGSTLALERSSVLDNTGTTAAVIADASDLDVRRSTIVGNEGGVVGGVWAGGGPGATRGAVTIFASTLVANHGAALEVTPSAEAPAPRIDTSVLAGNLPPVDDPSAGAVDVRCGADLSDARFDVVGSIEPIGSCEDPFPGPESETGTIVGVTDLQVGPRDDTGPTPVLLLDDPRVRDRVTDPDRCGGVDQRGAPVPASVCDAGSVQHSAPRAHRLPHPGRPRRHHRRRTAALRLAGRPRR
jgi:predicted outer membrane repeat protein